MDYAILIKNRVAELWKEYAALPGTALRGTPDAPDLRSLLEDFAERVCRLTVVDSLALTGTNILGQLDRDEETISLRSDLPPDIANFIIAHEIGHWALDHPLHVILDTQQEINPHITADDLSVARQQRLTGLDLSPGVLTALRGYNERDIYEMQANAFATELLIPGAELRNLLSDDPTRSVASLAQHFGIPESMVRVGMANALFSATTTAPPTDAAPAAPGNPTLDNDQERAAAADYAATLVVAGPGAGKTRILTTRYARLVTDKNVNPRNILALTFANKAAGEMRERLADLVGPEHAASVEVFTFHAFGLQLLQQYGERIGLKLPLRLITPIDALLLFRRYAAKNAYGFLSDLPRALENLNDQLKAVARAKEENAGPERWAELAQEWHAEKPEATPGEIPAWATDGLKFYQDYQKTLRRHGLVDYGDLQIEAVRLFSHPEIAAEIRERYQHIMVDEFQDINYVSGRLVHELVGGRKGVLWVVGDPRQGIYGFRGASPVNLSRFCSTDYPDAEIVSLHRNYRSVPRIVAAGTAIDTGVVSQDPALVPPLEHTRDSAEDQTPAVSSVRFPDGATERRWLASAITAEHKAGRRLSDIAVLVRKNKHAVQVAEALTAAGIPHRWGGPIEERPAFCVCISALLLAADDTRGIAGLTMLSPGADLLPDFNMSEKDRRTLFGDGRGRWSARRLLRAADSGEIAELSEEGRKHCRAMLAVAESLSASARPHHNLCIYLFEHAGWLRLILPQTIRTLYPAATILATTGQIIDLASGFAAQREALARSIGKADSSTGAKDSKSENEDGDTEVETATDTRAFLDYLTTTLDSGSLGIPNELPLDSACDAITVMTAHRSKGLEWESVFVPFCVEGQFPSSEQDNDLPIPPTLITTDDVNPSTAHKREETCLFYVALTRAKDRLRLSGAESYGPRTKGVPSLHWHAVEKSLQCAYSLSAEELVDIAAPDIQEASSPTEPGLPYTLPETIRESALTCYEDCPRQYLFSEVYRLRQDGSAFLEYYSTVYGAARDCGGDPVRLRELFQKNWEQDGPKASDWQTPLFKNAAETVIRTIEHRIAADTNAEPSTASSIYRQAKELTIALPNGDSHKIQFTVDEETQSPDGKRLYRRHKQSGRLPKNAPDDKRAVLYALLAEQEATVSGTGTNGTADVKFYYPHAGTDHPDGIGKQKCKKRKEKLIELLDRMKGGDMSPVSGESCKRCSYRLICSRKISTM